MKECGGDDGAGGVTSAQVAQVRLGTGVDPGACKTKTNTSERVTGVRFTPREPGSCRDRSVKRLPTAVFG